MTERQPEPSKELIETPSIEVTTNIGKVTCHWANTTLMRFEDPYEDHIEYNDGETLHKLNVLEADWNKLVDDDFPWEYWPNMNRFEEEDKIAVKARAEEYTFRPRNTKLLLFADHRFDHVEHSPRPNITRGIVVNNLLKKMLFVGDYPIKYSPFVDRATKEFFDSMGGPRNET